MLEIDIDIYISVYRYLYIDIYNYGYMICQCFIVRVLKALELFHVYILCLLYNDISPKRFF